VANTLSIDEEHIDDPSLNRERNQTQPNGGFNRVKDQTQTNKKGRQLERGRGEEGEYGDRACVYPSNNPTQHPTSYPSTPLMVQPRIFILLSANPFPCALPRNTHQLPSALRIIVARGAITMTGPCARIVNIAMAAMADEVVCAIVVDVACGADAVALPALRSNAETSCR
jgi:hypothetical protein